MTEQLKTILCIDDDEDILAITQMCLETVGGFRVTCFKHGINAVKKIESLKPDLILMDMMMPGVDGLSVLSSLKQTPTTAQIPVVFMTARVQANEIEQYYKQGADGVIPKPFDPMTLSQQLIKFWEAYHAKS